MPSVQIKDVPDATHAVLRRRAAELHQSLQEYLLAKLVADAAAPTLEEVMRDVAARPAVPVAPAEVAALVREDRAGR